VLAAIVEATQDPVNALRRLQAPAYDTSSLAHALPASTL